MFDMYKCRGVYCVELYIVDVDIDTDNNIPPHVHTDGIGEDENTADRDLTLGSMQDSNTKIETETNNEGDSSNIADIESCSEDDSLGDFDYFAEGDSLSDLDVLVANNEPAFDAEEDDEQSDPNVLSSPITSNKEWNVLKFPEFDGQRDLKKSNLEVALYLLMQICLEKL
ncbi:hypothetical protein Salat_0674400 [Sesamum alatum]|uniref:Uncharacterized protein n=1 Tax=Sesamum alatum TaxID=300844 RepID=A0AAE2CUI5_9LAMI|nr:hypothetical protein Salat_0674400 [Sesamum alatum]